MRTSNKILLGLLLTTTLVFTSLFAAVRIKYANGNIVTRKEGIVNDWSNVHQVKEPFKSVSIKGMGNLMIVPADAAKLEIWKDGPGVQWSVKDGVLYITPDTTGRENGQTFGKSWTRVELFLPNVGDISVFESEIALRNVADSGKLQPSFNFRLELSQLAIENGRNEQEVTLYDTLRVDANNNSELHFRRGIRVNELQARFSRSRLDEDDVNFGKLNIQVDSTSDIQLKGKNLRKATITSTE